jgi:hypothetical protein
MSTTEIDLLNEPICIANFLGISLVVAHGPFL